MELIISNFPLLFATLIYLSNLLVVTTANVRKMNWDEAACVHVIQGDQDHFYAKEMLISLSILKLHKNP